MCPPANNVYEVVPGIYSVEWLSVYTKNEGNCSVQPAFHLTFYTQRFCLNKIEESKMTVVAFFN
jgi:hypothetical protein